MPRVNPRAGRGCSARKASSLALPIPGFKVPGDLRIPPVGRGDPQPTTRTSGEELAGLPAGELLALCSAELRYHAKAKNGLLPTRATLGSKGSASFLEAVKGLQCAVVKRLYKKKH